MKQRTCNGQKTSQSPRAGSWAAGRNHSKAENALDWTRIHQPHQATGKTLPPSVPLHAWRSPRPPIGCSSQPPNEGCDPRDPMAAGGLVVRRGLLNWGLQSGSEARRAVSGKGETGSRTECRREPRCRGVAAISLRRPEQTSRNGVGARGVRRVGCDSCLRLWFEPWLRPYSYFPARTAPLSLSWSGWGLDFIIILLRVRCMEALVALRSAVEIAMR